MLRPNDRFVFTTTFLKAYKHYRSVFCTSVVLFVPPQVPTEGTIELVAIEAIIRGNRGQGNWDINPRNGAIVLQARELSAIFPGLAPRQWALKAFEGRPHSLQITANRNPSAS